MKIKKKARSPNRFKKILVFPVIIFFVVLSLMTKKLVTSPVNILFHGPNLSDSLYKSGLNKDTLGYNTNLNSPRPIITSRRTNRVTPTPRSTPTLVPTPITNQTTNQFGIAAGGGLVSLNQNELDLYFQQLKELGVGWVRWDFDWGGIQESGPVDYNWVDTDRIVQTANIYGIKTLGIITYTPLWAQSSTCKGTFACVPADPLSFGIFAGKVAAHYAPLGLHYWEIWNEPNIPMFWRPKPDVNLYVEILRSAYANIKKSDSSSVVLSGGLSPAGDEGDNIAPITFIRKLYELDITKDFDGIALHPYSYPVVASYPASWNSWQQIEEIRQIMTDHGDGNKPIWITEYGAPTGGPGITHETTQLEFTYGEDYMSENAQGVMMDDVLLLYSRLSGPMGPFFWYSLKNNGTNTDTPENFFGLLRFDGSKKPAYFKYQMVISNSKQ